ncbi:GntR family transcriptional regulator [Nocardioides sp.]|jgi:DNA-binding GntR family transcriptional regulator|uniref:GntR family transcriptional regulator n=1 Tax=Nocardioides sp. TaxID=35761 RepID=UPI002C0C164A|nr:GntR family transcriptional regulator [Nocardioides sp.]HVX55646.1 GntR family transcriptional regulator [Nocardioides sp.]
MTQTPEEPIRPNTLAMQAYAALRRRILTGELKPGERLSEVAVAQLLGVTRGPVREALRVLAEEQLVVLVPHKGAAIPQLSRQEMIELYQYREALEVMIVRLICAQAREDMIEALRDLLDQTRRGMVSRGNSGYPEDHDWHMELARMCGNSVIATELGRLHGRLRLVRLQSSAEPRRAESALDEHRDILEAIEAGNVEKAEAATRAHIESALNNVLCSLEAAAE